MPTMDRRQLLKHFTTLGAALALGARLCVRRRAAGASAGRCIRRGN
jgi:hypothetical protein